MCMCSYTIWGFHGGDVIWDIKIQFVPYRKHITSPLQIPAGWRYVRFEVFTAVTMKNTVVWDIKTQAVHVRNQYFNATESNRLMLCKSWGFHGGDYEECRLLWCKNPVYTSQETHFVSATQPSRLMLCKIWGFLGGDYEECRLLGYKNPVRTSQETNYVSATESSRLMLCKIWGFQADDCETAT
jgi:hypothetical protein